MFSEIKDQISFVDVYNFYLGEQFPLKGDGDTLSTEEDDCPWCGHNGCFKVKVDEGFAKCFSSACVHPEHPADHIEFVRRTLNLGSPGEAAIRIIKDMNLDIDTGWSNIQRIYNMSAEYYRRNMLDTHTYRVLDDLSPSEYQMRVRGHTQATLDRIRIGWADGGLHRFLLAEGFPREDILASGLCQLSKKEHMDIEDYMSGCFVYPHYDERGRVGNFTMKLGRGDKRKKVYQIPKKVRPITLEFYGQNELHYDDIAIVEGENDRASLYDIGWQGGVLATNGQLSKAQLAWMKENLRDKRVSTFFDNDEAGIVYIEKVWKAGALGAIQDLRQYQVDAESGDVDKLIQNGGAEAFEVLTSAQEIDRPDDQELEVIEIEDLSSPKVAETNGSYYAIKYTEEGEKHVQLTNFVIELRNVYIRDGKRMRELIAVHNSGYRSEPFLMDSEQKVSLKAFKELAANAVDGFFKGNEQDMINIWEHIYSNSAPNIVQIPVGVGNLTREMNDGWLFRNVHISKEGVVTVPDEKGVFWPTGRQNKHGIKPVSIKSSLSDSAHELASHDLPGIDMSLEPEEWDDLLGSIVHHLSVNLNNPGMALTMLGWCMAAAASNKIFKKYGFFPFLLLWGRHGKGKTTVARWLLSLFSMDSAEGYTTISQLKSNVGFERKAMYYNSMPLCIDEVRADRQTSEKYGIWRGYYNRSPRTMGTKEGFNVKIVPVNSVFMFCGQDTFTDAAMRNRCLALKIPVDGRDHSAYEWMEANKDQFSAVLMKWILDFCQADFQEVFIGMSEVEKHISSTGCEARTSKLWSIAAFFGLQLQQQFMPGFDYLSWVVEEVNGDISEQEESSLLTEFWDSVSGLQVSDHPTVGPEQIRFDSETDKMYVWVKNVYDQVNAHSYRGSDKEKFSFTAIRQAIKEEGYFLGDDRVKMGRDGRMTRVIVIDVAKIPENNPLTAVAQVAKARYI